MLFDAEYKQEHESFVSNLAGTNFNDLVATLLLLPLSLFVVKRLSFRLCLSSVGEAAALICFLVAVLTFLAPFTPLVLLVLLVAILADCFSSLSRYFCSSGCLERGTSLHFITDFKGMIVCITCLSILAVDFRAFPRRFAKTETFGLSLMDLGTGAFLLSSALTSRYARGLSSEPMFWTGKRFCVLALGVGRAVALKLLRYPEHLSEYGVHWNFFVSLYAVWTVADVAHLLLSRTWISFASIVALGSYQAALSWGELSEYLVREHREGENVIDGNKEGLWSLFGYIPLYLLSEQIAYRALYCGRSLAVSAEERAGQACQKSSCSTAEDDGSDSRRKEEQSSRCHTVGALQRLGLSSLLLWFAWGVICGVQPTSRRMANANYVLLTMSCCFSLLLCFLAIGHLPSDYVSSAPMRLLSLLSRQSLWVFLGANLLTGLVNVTVDTIRLSHMYSVFILLVHTIVFSVIAYAAEVVQSRSTRGAALT